MQATPSIPDTAEFQSIHQKSPFVRSYYFRKFCNRISPSIRKTETSRRPIIKFQTSSRNKTLDRTECRAAETTWDGKGKKINKVPDHNQTQRGRSLKKIPPEKKDRHLQSISILNISLQDLQRVLIWQPTQMVIHHLHRSTPSLSVQKPRRDRGRKHRYKGWTTEDDYNRLWYRCWGPNLHRGRPGQELWDETARGLSLLSLPPPSAAYHRNACWIQGGSLIETAFHFFLFKFLFSFSLFPPFHSSLFLWSKIDRSSIPAVSFGDRLFMLTIKNPCFLLGDSPRIMVKIPLHHNFFPLILSNVQKFNPP